jgi:hypothetical protein
VLEADQDERGVGKNLRVRNVTRLASVPVDYFAWRQSRGSPLSQFAREVVKIVRFGRGILRKL